MAGLRVTSLAEAHMAENQGCMVSDDRDAAHRLLCGSMGCPLCSVNSTEVLRDALRDLLEQDDDLDAVRDALAEWKDGDAGMPIR